jgi:hypothetical protein
VRAAVEAVYGWSGDGPRARIAVDRTINGFAAAGARVREVAGSGGRIVFATECPASLFAVHRALANHAVEAGGDVFDAVESSPIDDRGAPASPLLELPPLRLGVECRANGRPNVRRRRLIGAQAPRECVDARRVGPKFRRDRGPQIGARLYFPGQAGETVRKIGTGLFRLSHLH